MRSAFHSSKKAKNKRYNFNISFCKHLKNVLLKGYTSKNTVFKMYYSRGTLARNLLNIIVLYFRFILQNLE